MRENEPYLRDALNELRRVPLVGDVRGAGYFWSVEMVKDRDTRETFEGAEADWLLRDVLTAQMVERGLLCRLDDRGDPVIQLSPAAGRRPAAARRDGGHRRQCARGGVVRVQRARGRPGGHRERDRARTGRPTRHGG